MIVAEPGSLQQALNDGAQNGELVRCRNGATFQPNGVTVPAGVTLDARPANFLPPSSGVMISFRSDAVMWGGYVEQQSGFDGAFFEIRAEAGDTITGPIGPCGTFIFGEYGIDESKGVRMVAEDGGVIENTIGTHLYGHFVGYVFDLRAEGDGRIENVEMWGWSSFGWNIARVRGTGPVIDPLFSGHMQPDEGVSTEHILIDNPNCSGGRFEGMLWDARRLAEVNGEYRFVYVEEGSDFAYTNWAERTTGQDYGDKIIKDDGDGTSRFISLNNLEDRSAAERGVQRRRGEVDRYYRAAGLVGDEDRPAPEPDPEPEYDHELRVQATGSLTPYEFAVGEGGQVVPADDLDSGGDGADTISDNGLRASGAVDNDGFDRYYFNGELTRFERDGDLDLFVDGEEVDPDGFGSSGLDRTVSIVGDGPRVEYELTVSGELEKSTARDGSINSGDEIDGSTASGYVLGGTDSYRFAGEITDLTVDDPDAVSIYLDGEEVDPARFGGSDSFELTISNRGYDEPATYQFTVTGKIEATASVNPNDEIDGSTGTGQVNGGADTYRYTGAITAFDNDGPLDVAIDGNTVYSSG
jgi:hypothetical protein